MKISGSIRNQLFGAHPNFCLSAKTSDIPGTLCEIRLQ